MAWHGGLSNFCWPLLNDLWVGSPDHIPWRIKSTQSTQQYFNICIYIYLYHEFWYCTITLCCLLEEYCKYVHIIMYIYIFIYTASCFAIWPFVFLQRPQICTTYAGRVRSSTFVLHYGEAGHGGSLKETPGGLYKELLEKWKKSCITWDAPKGLDTGIKPTFRAS